MKIVHISPDCVYTDNWGYQDNLLPKHQHKLGHDVTMITSQKTRCDNQIVDAPCGEYDLPDGVHVIRLNIKNYPGRILTNLCNYLETYEILKKLGPDMIFIHGLNNIVAYDAVRYKKNNNPKCVIVHDNHMDHINEPYHSGVKFSIIRAFYRFHFRRYKKYISRVYGVTPERKLYAEDYYAVPKSLTDVLIMGADDDKIDFKNRDTVRKRIRDKYQILSDDFLIVTGGKIDELKNVHFLMQAASGMKNVKVLVFGSVTDSFRNTFKEIAERADNSICIGWLSSDAVYDYFLAADLVFFPGTHSVLWEQACASKTPCVFKKWSGTDHLDDGFSAYIDSVSIETIREKITQLHFTEDYYSMKQAALSEKTDKFLYSHIAKKSLECLNCNET